MFVVVGRQNADGWMDQLAAFLLVPVLNCRVLDDLLRDAKLLLFGEVAGDEPVLLLMC